MFNGQDDKLVFEISTTRKWKFVKTGKKFKSIYPPFSDGGKEYEAYGKISNTYAKGIKGGQLRVWTCRPQEMVFPFSGFSIFFKNFLKKVKKPNWPPLMASRIELVVDGKEVTSIFRKTTRGENHFPSLFLKKNTNFGLFGWTPQNYLSQIRFLEGTSLNLRQVIRGKDDK